MASIKKLKPGQTLWVIIRQKMGNTTISYGALYPIRVVEVHDDHVIASWNGNPAKKFTENSVKKWKVKKPEPKRKILGVNSY